MGRIQKVITVAIAVLLFMPLANFILQYLSVPLIIAITGVFLIVFAPKKVGRDKAGNPVMKRKLTYLALGFLLIIVSALETFNLLIIPVSADVIALVLAGLGVLLILSATGKDKNVSLAPAESASVFGF